MERDVIRVVELFAVIISTHALTWSATPSFFAIFSTGVHFNSRAHVERDGIAHDAVYRFQISTHALTWSATVSVVFFVSGASDFNSRAHVERDSYGTYFAVHA